MKLTASLLLLASLAAAEEPKAEQIEGGKTTTTTIGLRFDVPDDWTVTSDKPGVFVLMPEGANPSGVVEELYMLAYDKLPDADPGSKKVREELGKLRDGLLPGGTLDGDPKEGVFGDFEGLIYCYEGKAQDGRTARLWFHVWTRNDHVVALVALGYPKQLKKRKSDVIAILKSCRKSKKPKAAANIVRPELIGEWAWITNFSANNGGGRQTLTTVRLNADGSFRYHAESVSTNPFGAAWGNEDITGTWTATADKITFTTREGAATYSLEKRNHPKNVNDPMIVIDGKAYVTTTRREPWK
ncbi:MAG: hypothetical protein HYY18_03395 [Planctomycetes bacterium]|nr:hypothetical protein [Planctomycetota bacterium]